MVCSACGCEQFAGAQFCRQCGTRVMAAPPPPYAYAAPFYAPQPRKPRVHDHVQLLGLGWIVYGAVRLVLFVTGMAALEAMRQSGVFSDVPPFVAQLMGPLLPMMALLLVGSAAAAIAAGYGLLTRRSWARVLTIVVAILSLIKLPIGTALGAYSLWVLAPRASGEEWDGMAGSQPASSQTAGGVRA